MDERDRRGGPPDAGESDRERGGYGRLWARAMERRREQRRRDREEAAARVPRYRETGGGYAGYGGTADRRPWAPEEGRFGAGYSGYGGRGGWRTGGPYPGERRAPRGYAGVSGGPGPEEYETPRPGGSFWTDELRAERIGPGAYRRGGPWSSGRSAARRRDDLH